MRYTECASTSTRDPVFQYLRAAWYWARARKSRGASGLANAAWTNANALSTSIHLPIRGRPVSSGTNTSMNSRRDRPAVELNATCSAGGSTTALTQKLMIIARTELTFAALLTAASTLSALARTAIQSSRGSG